MTSVARGAVELVLLNVALAVACFGQFHNLAVTNDGSLVYFSTNLRLASEASLHLPHTPAIYRVNAAGMIERFSDPPEENYAFPTSHGNPQVSGDGAAVSYTEYMSCVGGSSCFLSHPTTYFSDLFVNGHRLGNSVGGSAQISRNGRYVLNYGEWTVFGYPTFRYDELRDLRSGLKTPVLVNPASLRQAVTSDGKVLGFDGTTLVLWSVLTARKIATAEAPDSAIVNDAGTVVVYEARALGRRRLRALELASGADTILTEAPDTSPEFEPSISNDGTLILYVATPAGSSVQQAWLTQPDGSGRRQFTDFPDGADEAILSGTGNVVIAVTGGRLVSIDTASGAAKDLIGRTPVCSQGFTALVPGSIFPFTGKGLADSTRVLSNGVPLPMVSAGSNAVWFQVPWALSLSAAVTVELEHSSLFEGCPAATVSVVARQPYFFSDAGTLTIAHQDFSGVVTAANPARPGEIVHAYAVGLGSVTPALQTGEATPAGQLYRVTAPVDCTVGTSVLDVPFAGLAPGLIGIYQIDIRMPEQIPAEGLFLTCGTPGNPVERHGGFVPGPGATSPGPAAGSRSDSRRSLVPPPL